VINDQCTTGKQRRITHWEHEDVLEAVQQRLNEHPEKMHQRRETVERPFGIIKCWVEFTYFQMKTLKHVGTETALHVLAHNLKRGMKIISIVPLAFGAPPHIRGHRLRSAGASGPSCGACERWACWSSLSPFWKRDHVVLALPDDLLQSH